MSQILIGMLSSKHGLLFHRVISLLLRTKFLWSYGKSGLPLYQNISENLQQMKDRNKAFQIKLDLIDEFENLRNKD